MVKFGDFIKACNEKQTTHISVYDAETKEIVHSSNCLHEYVKELYECEIVSWELDVHAWYSKAVGTSYSVPEMVFYVDLKNYW